ncbi:regulatory protein, tetR family [Amycolatopsis xylanica]|uniref:Regulatory protein, tetR family n=1 Tax=Amycolatopsis xylanica TaxID=589385 RepID=A0A1H3GL85_9PSEU|nr:TetR/AcrR family transcriptional regulator [Amycolatopsis xylanica]SDY03857.1 regulatory protein, tetR family [Amycolatopsis xylanica]
MPKQVDHEQRRGQIAEALLRLTAREGLEAVSLRHVATEAGVSMGAVQHYFKTKDEMLLYALQYQDDVREQRITASLASAGDSPAPREILRACLVEIIPTDDRSTSEWLVGVAYFIRALASPSMAEVYTENLPKLFEFFADQIRRAQSSGEVSPERNPHREAEILWALADAQGTSILLGQRTPAEAVALLDYHLDRLFEA